MIGSIIPVIRLPSRSNKGEKEPCQSRLSFGNGWRRSLHLAEDGDRRTPAEQTGQHRLPHRGSQLMLLGLHHRARKSRCARLDLDAQAHSEESAIEDIRSLQDSRSFSLFKSVMEDLRVSYSQLGLEFESAGSAAAHLPHVEAAFRPASNCQR